MTKQTNNNNSPITYTIIDGQGLELYSSRPIERDGETVYRYTAIYGRNVGETVFLGTEIAHDQSRKTTDFRGLC